jgi:Mg-chelatase subunit ChlD
VAVAALPTLPPVAQIKAGEINDNLQWENYLAYRARSAPIMGQVKDVDVSERYVIKVTDSDERPVLGARVQYFNSQSELIAEGRTYSSGETLFFPRATKAPPSETEFTVRVEKSGANKEFKLTRGTQTEWKTTLTLSAAQTPIKIDVLFLLDTTGSMGDELAQLQTNIISVSAQIAGLPGNPDTRYGLVAYRDRGDEYVTQISQFTPDVKTFQGSLNLLKAGGGGDIPEALNDGLHDALNGVEWSGDDTIKLIFLVTDAPPQLKYPGDFDYSQEMRDASKRGIKIFSLAASGLTPNGEYVLRQLAQQTMGNFIFITYQTPVPAQGQNPVDSRPGDNTNLTINKDDYQTELLDQLVVRLVRKEIAALKR